MHHSPIIALAISFALTVFSTASNAEVASPQAMRSGPVAKSLGIATIDCQLRNDKTISGRVIDPLGKPIANMSVVLSHATAKVGTASTDRNGRFQFSGLRPGVVAIAAGPATQMVRIWHERLAPPTARGEFMFVVGDVVRGQCDGGPNCSECESCRHQGHFGGIFQRMLHNPWLVGAGTAAAIAIPLATDDDDAS